MEVTAKMKDELVHWLAVQEKAMLNCDYKTGTDEFPVVIRCLGYINGTKALHVSDIRPIMMILGIPEEDAHVEVWTNADLLFRYEYSIMIGSVKYYSLHKCKWGEEV